MNNLAASSTYGGGSDEYDGSDPKAFVRSSGNGWSWNCNRNRTTRNLIMSIVQWKKAAAVVS
jgi:hypothetical protein